jgi:hypothetical protein
MGKPEKDIWKTPEVKAALQSRPADDIAVLACPRCGEWGYYNEGSHFSCRFCERTWYVCSEDEEAPDDRAYMRLDGHTCLTDTLPVEGEEA